MQSMASDPIYESPDPGNAEIRRRKIRKGTRSCWECKRRKTRCTFSTPSDLMCIGCRRRGTNCLSQDHPEETARSSMGDRMGTRIVRVEALIEKLVKQVGNGSKPSTPSDESTHIPPRSESNGEVDSAHFLTACRSPGVSWMIIIQLSGQRLTHHS